jgi:N-acetylmuramoyl-L-alanine amidase
MSGQLQARLGRRGLLAGALATGAAVLAGGGTAAAQTDRAARGRMTVHSLIRRSPADGSVPEILAVEGEAATAPGFPIEYLGLTWVGEGTAGRVRFRTASGWGSWRPVEQHDAVGDRQAALVPAGGAVEVEVEPAPGASDVQLLAINTTDGPASGLPFATPSRLHGCRYRNRAGWGADESLRFGGGEELWPAEFHDVQTLTVHHTATTVDDADPAATVRAIYFFQAVTQAWGDIGYHLLIDQAGVVYEGRYSGPDGLPVFRVAAGPPQLVDAGHALGFNTGNVGVVLLGDFTSVQPTAAARQALVRVLASLAHTCDLDPLGRTNYANPVTGATRTVNTISGHRDWNATQCPGNTFYPTLPALRTEVAELLEQGVPIR